MRIRYLHYITVKMCKLPKKSWRMLCVRFKRSANTFNFTNEDVLDATVHFDDDSWTVYEMATACPGRFLSTGHRVMTYVDENVYLESILTKAKVLAMVLAACFAGSRMRCVRRRTPTCPPPTNVDEIVYYDSILTTGKVLEMVTNPAWQAAKRAVCAGGDLHGRCRGDCQVALFAVTRIAQCPRMKIMLCLTPSSVWLAVILQSV